VLRRTIVVLAALAATLLVAPMVDAASAPFPVTIHAANGDVVIKSQPARIVSLSPTGTEDLFAVGAGKQVIAVDNDSDYPKNAPHTTLSGYTPNVEAIAGYKPDLVVVSNDIGGIVAALQKLGITVLLEPAADNLAEAYDEIRQLGSATGHAKQSGTVVAGMQRNLTSILRSVPKSRRHLTVYHELDPTYYSATSGTFIGRIYKLFGFRNIADAADTTRTGYPQLSAEYIVASNPGIVVLADTVCCKQSAATVAARPGWSGIAAVKGHRVIGVDDSVASRWGPRIVDFARAIAAAARKQ
jgi:iron complex transport system substrate-binding protein